MKRNWIIIAITALLTVAAWAQTATTPAPQTDSKACACCNHDMKADAKAHDMSGCCGKDAKACMRKGAKGCCEGMKKDAKLTTTAANDKAGCCGKDGCGKDCCKDGKCTMAKNGKKCCEHCQGMAEGK